MHTISNPLLTHLHLEDSGVPIYVQLRDQFLRLIGGGRLSPGDRMPTMREVAVALKVDLNTVRRAYDELERAGAIHLVQGRGSFVAERRAPADPDHHHATLDRLAKQAIALAVAAGHSPLSLAERLVQLAQTQEDPS